MATQTLHAGPRLLPKFGPTAAPTSTPHPHTWHFSKKDLLVSHLSILVLLPGMTLYCLSLSSLPPFLFSGPFFLSFKTVEETLHPLSQPDRAERASCMLPWHVPN